MPKFNKNMVHYEFGEILKSYKKKLNTKDICPYKLSNIHKISFFLCLGAIFRTKLPLAHVLPIILLISKKKRKYKKISNFIHKKPLWDNCQKRMAFNNLIIHKCSRVEKDSHFDRKLKRYKILSVIIHPTICLGKDLKCMIQ